MSESKRIPGFKLTPEQRELVDEVRRRVELEKPEILAESRRRSAADAIVSVQLRGVMSLLKAVRKTQGVTLDEVARRTGIAKPTLSRLENDLEANVTINTLHRIAEALGHAVQVSVIPQTISAMSGDSPAIKLPVAGQVPKVRAAARSAIKAGAMAVKIPVSRSTPKAKSAAARKTIK